MDKFLEKQILPKLTQKEVENLNISITSKEIELVNKNYPKRKSQYKMASHLKNTHYSQDFHKIEEETLPNSLYEFSITMIPKPDKDVLEKKIFLGQIFLMYIDVKKS